MRSTTQGRSSIIKGRYKWIRKQAWGSSPGRPGAPTPTYPLTPGLYLLLFQGVPEPTQPPSLQEDSR